jgi:hypothetical protein
VWLWWERLSEIFQNSQLQISKSNYLSLGMALVAEIACKQPERREEKRREENKHKELNEFQNPTSSLRG